MSIHRKVTELGLPVFEPSVSCGPHCYGGVVGMEEQKRYLESMEIDSDTWVRSSDCIALVDRIAELEAENARLREALIQIRNDDTQRQYPYYFWVIANNALEEAGDE